MREKLRDGRSQIASRSRGPLSSSVSLSLSLSLLLSPSVDVVVLGSSDPVPRETYANRPFWLRNAFSPSLYPLSVRFFASLPLSIFLFSGPLSPSLLLVLPYDLFRIFSLFLRVGKNKVFRKSASFVRVVFANRVSHANFSAPSSITRYQVSSRSLARSSL